MTQPKHIRDEQLRELMGEPPVRISQATRVINKMGGHATVARLLGMDRSQVYRWEYDKKKGGTGGLVPTQRLNALIEHARTLGILLSPDDLDPRARSY